MSDIDRTTEAYAHKYEEEFNQQFNTIDKYYPEFRKNITRLLELNTTEARLTIASIYLDDANLNIYKNMPEYAYMYEVSKVYINEYNSQYQHTIFDIADSIEGFMNFIEQTKYILWRVEFVQDTESKKNLLDFINTYKLSPYFIIEIMRTATFNADLFTVLIDIFSENNMLSFVFHLLDTMNQLSPGDENILCLLADLTGSIGLLDKSKSYLDQIKNPGEISERIRAKYGFK